LGKGHQPAPKYFRLFTDIFLDTNVPVKAALAMMGLIEELTACRFVP